MFFDSYRANSGATTTMWYAKSFVKINMAYIRAKMPWFRYTYYGIQICPIHIDLATCIMNHAANFPNVLFKHSVSRRISNHKSRYSVSILLNFICQVFCVHIAFLITLYYFNFEACENCACRICSMGRARY